MTACKRLFLVVMIVFSTSAWAQSNRREPHIGYLYPAGGQQGSVFQVTAGGQYLKGVTDVYVSGEGVRASVVRYVGRFRLDGEQSRELWRRLTELWEKRQAELAGAGSDPVPSTRESAMLDVDNPNAKRTGAVPLPYHPLLENLEHKSLRELAHLRNEFMNFRRRQRNAQIEETVLIEVAVDSDAARGNRELRLRASAGLTNPMCFQVGQLPEICETELNDPNANVTLPEEPPIDLPVLLNGQIMPGDVDRFRFRARRGQRLVLEAQARRLVPYLADAVPGWFQATIALYDARGKEVAYEDDYRFSPDPVLFYEIPEDGVYELEVRDAIYRGREDFVYRIAVGEQPFITGMYPLGGQSGVATAASIAGWNLSSKRLPLDTHAGADRIRKTVLRQDTWCTNSVTYVVDTMPECNESEPNDTARNAQRINLPRIVNGRIARAGDVDVFRFVGRAGDQVVAEVCARRLHSPLDSLLRLTDASGTVLEWNDDTMDKDGHLHRDMGLLTHHADSYLRARLPEDGVYLMHVADSQHHGGEAYGYRLRIGPPQPDFDLRMTPPSINVPAGRAVPVCMHVLRKDGFDGDIELVLKDAPAGFALNGGRIPAGRDRVRMTLTAPREPLDQPVVLRLEGRARIDGQTVSRPVVPSEDMMQAFLYRHLVPSRELMVAVRGAKYQGRLIELASSSPVRIPAGGTTRVRMKAPRHPRLREIELELREPPEGVTLHDVTVVPVGLSFQLKADGEAVQAGFADNLIVEAFIERAGGDAPEQPRRVSLGLLPAIPFEIVRR